MRQTEREKKKQTGVNNETKRLKKNEMKQRNEGVMCSIVLFVL
jgi:hypothetical protein